MIPAIAFRTLLPIVIWRITVLHSTNATRCSISGRRRHRQLGFLPHRSTTMAQLMLICITDRQTGDGSDYLVN